MVDFWTVLTMCPAPRSGWLIPMECKFLSPIEWITVIGVAALVWWAIARGLVLEEDEDD